MPTFVFFILYYVIHVNWNCFFMSHRISHARRPQSQDVKPKTTILWSHPETVTPGSKEEIQNGVHASDRHTPGSHSEWRHRDIPRRPGGREHHPPRGRWYDEQLQYDGEREENAGATYLHLGYGHYFLRRHFYRGSSWQRVGHGGGVEESQHEELH